MAPLFAAYPTKRCCVKSLAGKRSNSVSSWQCPPRPAPAPPKSPSHGARCLGPAMPLPFRKERQCNADHPRDPQHVCALAGNDACGNQVPPMASTPAAAAQGPRGDLRTPIAGHQPHGRYSSARPAPGVCVSPCCLSRGKFGKRRASVFTFMPWQRTLVLLEGPSSRYD
jgi:hypothetical protein